MWDNVTAGESYFRKQRVLTVLFKDRCKVKSLLKEGPHCFEMKQNVLFGERFQKKVGKTIKSKTKTTDPLKKCTKPTTAKLPHGSINHINIRSSSQEMVKVHFIPGEEEVSFDYNTHVTPISSISLKSKTPEILNLRNCQILQPFVKRFFKETR